MLYDPVDGFFSGLCSGFVRKLLAVGGILAGALISFLPGVDFSENLSSSYIWLSLTIGPFFWWARRDALFLLGLFSVLAMLTYIVLVFRGYDFKHAVFIIFSAATIYFAPISIQNDCWVISLLIYSACSLVYWLLPYGLPRLDRNP